MKKRDSAVEGGEGKEGVESDILVDVRLRNQRHKSNVESIKVLSFISSSSLLAFILFYQKGYLKISNDFGLPLAVHWGGLTSGCRLGGTERRILIHQGENRERIEEYGWREEEREDTAAHFEIKNFISDGERTSCCAEMSIASSDLNRASQ